MFPHQPHWIDLECFPIVTNQLDKYPQHWNHFISLANQETLILRNLLEIIFKIIWKQKYWQILQHHRHRSHCSHRRPPTPLPAPPPSRYSTHSSIMIVKLQPITTLQIGWKKEKVFNIIMRRN